MNLAIGSGNGNVNTKNLFVADAFRDSKHSALKLFVRGHMVWNRNGQAEKAAKLYKIIKQHGLDMANESYSTQSNLTNSLLTDFAKPENTAIIEEINLTELIADYTNAETSFKNLARETLNIEAEKKNYIAASSQKRKAFQLQKDTVEYLNVMHKSNPEKYVAISSVIAELVNSLNQKIRNRYKN